MKIVQITTDRREHDRDYGAPEPYFGTAPEGLLDGFKVLPEAEVHVISCTKHKMAAPSKLAPNVWFHQPLIPGWAWGRTLFSGSVIAVRKLVRKINPDIVHGQGTERDCALAAVLSGRPNVLTIHGNMRVHANRPDIENRRYYKFAAAIESFCLKRTDGVVAISRYNQDLVTPLSPQTWLVPNAVDPRFLDLQCTPPAVPRILFVGSLDSRKNPIGLLEACEPLLRAGQCTIGLAGVLNGASEYGKRLSALLDSIPSVERLGFLDRDRLAAEFSRSSLVVLPTFEDNCPMVVLEAMAAGLPVAASAVGGVPDLVEEGVTGMMFDPREPGAMRKVVETLVNDRELRSFLGKNGREVALQRFHPEIIARKHLDLYREVLRGHPR